MATQIDVESGNPYRDASGHFGTSPDKKLTDSFKALQGKKFVPKGEKGNQDLIAAKKAEAEEKLTALRSGSDTPTTGWKASGTQEEVDAFAKDSAIQDTLLHGTNANAQSSITSEGFTVGTAIDERIFGEGVYLTNSQTSAEFYAGRAGGDSSNVVSMKINVKNPYIDKGGYDHKVGKYGVSKYTKDFYDWGVENKHWRNPDSYEKKTDSQKNYNKFTAQFSEHLLETHDAIVKYDNSTDYIAIVKDPKNIMVVNNGK